MNKRQIEKIIPIAIKSSKKYLLNKDTKIPREYKGYISSFGASIIQSGLISTVAFFEADDPNSVQDRSKLTKLMLDVIYENNNIDIENRKEKLLDYVIENKDNEDFIKEDIINTAIAVKLAIRVFEFTKE